MPATILRDVFNATNPAIPLPDTDERYVDCTDARGGGDVVSRLFQKITWSNVETKQLFTGHRGCGKSTELLRLKGRLESAAYAVIYFEADEILDLNDIVYSDVLLAITQQIARYFDAEEIKLDQSLIDDVTSWFATITKTEVSASSRSAEAKAELSAGTIPLFSPLLNLLGTISGQIKTGIESKKEIRHELDPQISQLIDNINQLLIHGKAKLRAAGKEGLVIIIDNLDRIIYRNLPDGRNSHDALYIEHGEQLCSLKCDLIYTVPVSICYSTQSSLLRTIFPDHLMILPMIKIRQQHEPTDTYWQPGLNKLREILEERIDLDQIFEEEALNLLCRSSGGHLRDLMYLVREACGYAVNRFPKPINLNAVERATQQLTNEYARLIPEEHFALLAATHASHQIKNDDEHRIMLHNLSILEYINGVEPWHDVHPAILPLAKFRAALEVYTHATNSTV